MKAVGQADPMADVQPQSSASATFVLGPEGPSPSRKGMARGRTATTPSKIPSRPLGVNGVLPAHAAAPAVTGNGVRSQQPVWPSAPQAAFSGVATAAPAAAGPSFGAQKHDTLRGAAVPAVQAAGSGGGAGGLPLFAVGAADGQPVGFGTPRGSRSRGGKQKANGTPPLHPKPPTPQGIPAFSPIAMTPMDANTYQKMGSQTGPMETSPMDITPQGSVTSSAIGGATNMFVVSPLAGAAGSGQSAPTPSFGPTAAPGPAPAAAAPASVTIPSFSAGRNTSGGSAAPQPAAPFAPGASFASNGTTGVGLRFPIQIQIPGAREVKDLFSSAATSASAGAASRSAGVPATAAGPTGSLFAGGWQAAAAKKAHDANVGGGLGSGGAAGAHPGLAGNDCQPAKDNAPKTARAASDSSGAGVGSAAAAAPAAAVSSGSAAAPTGQAAAPAPTAASAATSSTAAAADPELLAAMAAQFELIAQRAREAAAAATAARAGGQEAAPAAAAGLTSDAMPAVPSALIEMMLRPAGATAAASDPAPGLAAAVASVIGGISGLKVEDTQSAAAAAVPREAAAGASAGTAESSTERAAGNSAGSGQPSTSGGGAAAGAAPSVPFVFGGAAQPGSAGGVAGGGAATPPRAFGGAPAAAPPAVPFVFKAGSPGPAPGAAGVGSGFGIGVAPIPFTFGATAPPSQPAASAAPPAAAAAAGLRPQHAAAAPNMAAGPSPMSTTPVQPADQPSFQPSFHPQQRSASTASSSGWASAQRPSPGAGGGSAGGLFGGGSSGGGGVSGDSGGASATASGFAGASRPFSRVRTKVTPRKAGRPTSAHAEAAAPAAAAAGPAGAASLSARMAHLSQPASAAAPQAAARPFAQVQQPQPQAPPQPQPSSSSGGGGGGLDAVAVQAVQLKRSADDKKTHGNQKYEQSDFRAAERWYSEAIEVLEGQLVALPLPREKMQQLFPTLKTEIAVLYSNRSGARLMTSKPQSALEDALRAMALDPKFMRAASRAATCHCRLGDFAAAHRIIEAAMDRCSASSSHYQDMLKKLNEVIELASRARAVTAAAVAAAASGSREKLQEAADQLAAVRDQVAYCDVVAAARAVVALRLGAFKDCLALAAPHPEVPHTQRAAPWRLWLTLQARYFRGDLQDALTTCRELHLALEAAVAAGKPAHASEPPAASPGGPPQSAAAAAYATSAHVSVPPPAALAELAETIQQQLKLKEDGNAAIKSGRHSEAAELYSRALGLGCPPAFAALLHANRAAAHAGQGQLADAVADCGRARALDPAYYKANVRMAALMVELRRPENAQGLLEPLTRLGAQAAGAGPGAEELAAIKERLSEARAAAVWQKTPHHYKLLGLTNTCSEEDVRKAYRRLALKHHPDKAMAAVKVALQVPGAAGAPPYSGPLAGGSELETRVREEAAWLFNFINQANEELSDKVRRRKVDQLLEAEQPPYSRYGSAASSNPYGSGGSRYGGGFSNFYSNFDPFFQRPAAAAGGAGSRPRAGSATGTGSAGGGYGAGYGAYGASRPASSSANGAAPGGGSSSARSSGGAAAGSGAARGAAAAPGGGYGAGGGFRRAHAGGSSARPAAAAASRKWWEGAGDDSDEEDQDTFNF